MSNPTLSRRDFLKTGGSLVVAFSFGPLLDKAAMAADAAPKPLAPGEVASFLAIGADGTVTCYSGKVDLGTGVRHGAARRSWRTSSRSPLEKVELVMGDTLLTPDQGVTSGSFSIEVGGMQIRQACATARAALVSEAAKSWKVAESGLTTADGMVRAKSGSRSVSFDELVGGKQFLPARWIPRRRCSTRRGIASSGVRSLAWTFPARSPASSPSCRTSACPACCTRASCGPRPSAPAC